MNSGIQKYAIIVAGGSGTRMNSSTPKQFIPINGRPVLMHTIQRFADYSTDIQLILVLPSSQINEWVKLCIQYQFQLKVKVVEGGETRFHSVKNGLDVIDNLNSLVAIHDGVRPFIKNSIIEESFNQAEVFGSAIASVSLKDSIRYVDSNLNRAENRAKFKLIQTPQTFKSSLIKTAYQTTTLTDFTDDAGVLKTLNLSHLENQDFLNLSGGEQQLIWLAQIMIQETEIVLLDEPTQQLDVYNKKKVFALMQQWVKEKGRLVICITHDITNLYDMEGHILNLALTQPKLQTISTSSVKENLQILESSFNVA